jgi:hypothetical protein
VRSASVSGRETMVMVLGPSWLFALFPCLS